jgi:hypothetical protein
MKHPSLVPMGLLLLIALPGRGGEDPRMKAEVKWARGVAEDFFDGVFKREEIVGLLSPELASAHLKGPFSSITRPIREYSTATITLEQMAPDHTEVRFLGILKGDRVEADFILRIARGGGGAWAIRYITIREKAKKK